MVEQRTNVSGGQTLKRAAPPPISTPVTEPTPTKAPSNARVPPLSEKPPRLNRDQVYDLLMNARDKEWVELTLEDGRSISGGIVFNEFGGTGRLINVDEEFACDFKADEVLDVKC